MTDLQSPIILTAIAKTGLPEGLTECEGGWCIHSIQHAVRIPIYDSHAAILLESHFIHWLGDTFCCPTITDYGPDWATYGLDTRYMIACYNNSDGNDNDREWVVYGDTLLEALAKAVTT